MASEQENWQFEQGGLTDAGEEDSEGVIEGNLTHLKSFLA